MEKFSKIEYERPNFEEIQKKYDEFAALVSKANSFEEVDSIIREEQKMTSNFMETSTVAFIRCYQDSSNEFYINEMQECQKGTELLNWTNYSQALLSSKFADDINKKYGKRYLEELNRDMRLTSKGQDERIEESILINKYQNLKATLKFDFDGKTMSEGELIPFLSSSDRAVRKQAKIARYEGYLAHRDEFIDIMDKLVDVRLRIAKVCEFDSFLDYMNLEKGRTTYGEKELTEFCQQVKTEIVPLLDRIRETKRKNLALDEIMEWDETVFFKDGNAKPAGDIHYLLDNANKMYNGLSSDIGALYDEMRKYDMIDVFPSKNKISGMGFCTILSDKKMPFIFANSNGTTSDVDVFTHEFGHAYQQMLSAKTHPLMAYYDMPNDIVEIPSKSMEQFAYKYADVFFDKDADKYVQAHLLGVVEEICLFASINEYETYLYNNPNATPEERIENHIRIMSEYNPNLNSGDLEKYHTQGASMFSNMGIYMFPRYLVSYALSNICALEFKSQFDKDESKAMENYKNFCAAGGSMYFEDILAAANLSKAYEKETVTKTADYLKTIL